MPHRGKELLQALAVEDVGAPGPRREALLLEHLVADGAHLPRDDVVQPPPLRWPSGGDLARLVVAAHRRRQVLLVASRAFSASAERKHSMRSGVRSPLRSTPTSTVTTRPVARGGTRTGAAASRPDHRAWSCAWER